MEQENKDNELLQKVSNALEGDRSEKLVETLSKLTAAHSDGISALASLALGALMGLSGLHSWNTSVKIYEDARKLTQKMGESPHA